MGHKKSIGLKGGPNEYKTIQLILLSQVILLWRV
jgi:hypothetical protein